MKWGKTNVVIPSFKKTAAAGSTKKTRPPASPTAAPTASALVEPRVEPKGPPPNAYLFQSPPGLAKILQKELVYAGAIERKQDLFVKLQRNHDLVFVQHLKSDEGLPRVRIAEQILKCPVFGRYKISQRQLSTMAETLKPLGARRLVVQVAGKHFDRRDLSRWLTKELETRGYSFDQNVEEEVWMFCIDDAYYFGMPQRKFREVEGRDERAEEREGSLPPPIAAALAFAGMPKPEDVIVDPVCGSGTLLAEAFAFAPSAVRLGVDIDPVAVRAASVNLGANAVVAKGDSRATGWDRKDVTLVLANLPFGVQFGDKATNAALYTDILREMLRLANPDRFRAILFTSDIVALRTALAAFPSLSVQDLFRVKVRGELATAVLATRR